MRVVRKDAKDPTERHKGKFVGIEMRRARRLSTARMLSSEIRTHTRQLPEARAQGAGAAVSRTSKVEEPKATPNAKEKSGSRNRSDTLCSHVLAC